MPSSGHAINQPLLELRDLVPGYSAEGRRTAVAESIQQVLRARELVCLIGPNGAGKSTLMRTMAGLQPPLDGEVRLSGEDVHRMAPPDRARQLAVVLTETIHVPMLTAYDLVAFGRAPYTDWRGQLTPEDRRLVVEALREVGAAEFAPRTVSELSDGERQRVMIARALAQQPSVMILDEITGFLDLPHRIEILRLLRRTAHERGCAVFLSTHDLDLALRMADRIWLMPKGRPLRADLPEMLVLNGAFQAAFSLDDVSFDQQSGAFRVQHPRRWPVSVGGGTSAAMWTQRALERHGFYVASHGETAAAVVEVTDHAELFEWRVQIAGRSSQHATLDELVHSLRARLTERAGDSAGA
jgi:iron complex transport system ATP-binding protein